MNLNELLQRLDGVRPQGEGYMARCPAHNDKNPSLSLREKDGKILVKCHAGCTFNQIMDSLGMELAAFGAASPATHFPAARKVQKPEAEYLYRDGQLKKLKYRNADGSKYCTWRHKAGGCWQSGRGGMAPGLYHRHGNMPNCLFVVEGEKDVDTLGKYGLEAVSLPDGANSKWLDSYTEFFRDKWVTILPDYDEPGKKYAEMVARNIVKAADRVIMVNLWEDYDLPEKGDVSDAVARWGDEVIDKISQHMACDPAWEMPKPACPVALHYADTVEYTPPEFLIEPYFPMGKGTLIQADPGTGKTAFMCAIAAAVTSGASILGVPVQVPGKVLLISVEDEEGVLRGRVEACGGNPSKIAFLDDAGGLRLDSPEIGQLIEAVNAKLIVFDPFQAFLGSSVDMNRANETRPVLTKLFDICQKRGCACAIVAHTSKSVDGRSAVYQSLGSVDIPAAMRSIIHIKKDPQNPKEILAFHIKSSNAAPGQTLHYTIGSRGGVQWLKRSDTTLEKLGKPDTADSPQMEAVIECVEAALEKCPEGGFFSYADFNQLAVDTLGSSPWVSSRQLSTWLMMAKDALPCPVTPGVRKNAHRGILLSPAQGTNIQQSLPADW